AGALDVAARPRSLTALVQRTETLRTAFVAVDGSPHQVVTAEQDLPLRVHDLTGWPDPRRQAEAARLVQEEARWPFDLAQAPLVRATLLRLAPDEHVLLLSLHHIISDGWSMRVLLRDLAALYTALATGNPVALSELPIQY